MSLIGINKITLEIQFNNVLVQYKVGQHVFFDYEGMVRKATIKGFDFNVVKDKEPSKVEMIGECFFYNYGKQTVPFERIRNTLADLQLLASENMANYTDITKQ